MTIKALMVDVDGVLIVDPGRGGWTATLEQDIGVSPTTLQTAFFARHWDEVIHGRAALRDRLAPVLQDIAPQVTCDTLIDYWFSRDAHLNTDLLSQLASLRASGIEVHLATVQEHERARYLWNDLDFRSRFDGMHYAADLGHAKPARAFYEAIEVRTSLRPSDLFLIDDKIANVEGAIASGWGAAFWTGDDTVDALIRHRP